MNSMRNFLKVTICFLSTLPFCNTTLAQTDQNASVDLVVKGYVSKGSCSFSFSHKAVTFSQPVIARNVQNDVHGDAPTEPFSLEYVCQDYNGEELPDLQVSLAADSQSSITHGKLAPKEDITHAAFSLRQCNSVKGDCQPIDFSGNSSTIAFPVANGDNEKHFEAKVVKLDNTPVNAGKLSAAVVFTFLQP